ncbi:MAG: non-canonical purine NTP pyrophosphatase [Gemmatimonadales bacterium]
MKVLVATRSAGKRREIEELFAGLPLRVVFPDEAGLDRVPEEAELERTDTYAGNAIAKARHFAQRARLPTVADDSGIEVDALGGAPGVHSARFAIEHGQGAGRPQDEANNALLLERLADVPDDRRTARYRCVVAYLESPTAAAELVEATCEGRILTAPRGSGGFGYDPVFYSLDLQRGFGEVLPATKHRVSHRGRAFRALIEVLLRRSV